MEEFQVNIRDYLAELEARIGESNEIDHRFKFVGLCGLYVLHFQLFRTTDKKLFKAVWDVYKKVRHLQWFSLFLVIRALYMYCLALSVNISLTTTHC